MRIERVIEISILALASMWVPLRLLIVRSAESGSPRLRKLLVLYVAMCAALIVSITILAPALLRPLAILAGAGFSFALWRARPSFGRHQGLPPGTLGLRSSLQALGDYRFYEKQFRRYGPIFKTSQYYRPVVCIVGLSRARELLRRHQERLTPSALPINRLLTGGLLRYMQPDRHKIYRKLLHSCMTPQVIRDCEPFAAEQSGVGLSAIADGGAHNPNAGVRPEKSIDQIAFVVCARVFLGLQPQERAVETLMRLYHAVDHRRIFLRAAPYRLAMEEILDIVRKQAERLRNEPPGMLRSFLGEAVHNDPLIVSDKIFLENLVFFLHVARCDLGGLLGWLLKMLCDYPEWGLRVRAELGQPGNDRDSMNLSDRFVSETLRLRQSEYLYRTTSHPVEFEGFLIPTGWLIRLCIRESHTSGDVFESPLTFNPDRFLTRSYSQEEYQPFGAYDHSCMGVHMTKSFARVFVEQAVLRFNWALVRDGPMELGIFQHGHWKPSSSFRIRLLPRRPVDSSGVESAALLPQG